jgi:TonB-linked SusC/RagA family outer membrane protein
MRYIFLSIFTCLSSFLIAQEVTITGKVTDSADNKPLQGVTVTAFPHNARQIQVATNDQGNYLIRVPSSVNELTFTYSGMVTAIEKIPSTHVLNVQLKNSNTQLEQVVVTALGIRRETKALTYSRQKMDVGSLTEAPSSNIVSALSGKVAGVQITPASTSTGSARIVIRGNKSITGNNQPLFIVDGVPIDNSPGDASVNTDGGGGLDYGNGAANINPEDIANIEILKGPNAAALYGSRAANGVVLITTKKSSSEKFKLSFNSNTSFQRINQFPLYQNIFGIGSSYKLEGTAINPNSRNIPDLRLSNYYRSWGPPMMGQMIIGFDGKLKEYRAQPNNVRDFFKTALMTINSAVVEGGSAKYNYRLSYTNTIANSVVENTNLNDRHVVNLRVLNNFTSWLTVDAKITYTNNAVKNRQYPNASNKNPVYMYNNMVRSTSLDELRSYKDAYGKEVAGQSGAPNPFWLINENENKDTRDQAQSAFSVDVTLNKWLKMTGRLGTDMSWVKGFEFNNIGGTSSPTGFMKVMNNDFKNFNLDGMLVANPRFSNILTVNAVLGVSGYRSSSEGQSYTVNSLIEPGLVNIGNSNELPTPNQARRKKSINSVFSSLSLGYKQFLFVDATARNDWSSTLPKKNNSYFYPSIGGTFIFTELFKIVPTKILSFGKLRISRAMVGNDLDPYQLYPTFGFSGIYNNLQQATLSTTLLNPDLKPERTYSTEYGVDLKMINNRIDIGFTHYKSSTKDQIIQAQVTGTSGYTKKYYNAGEIANWGNEVVVSATIIKSAKPNEFGWSTTINYAKNNSKVVSLLKGINRFQLNNWVGVAISYAQVGQPYGIVYGRAWRRDSLGRKLVDPTNGYSLTTPDAVIGNATPDWLGGITNSFKYKNFDFSFLVDAKIGGSVYLGSLRRAYISGAHLETLEGREDYYLHYYIYGESSAFLTGGFKWKDTYYPDGQPNNYYMNPNTAFQGGGGDINEELYSYDATYIKLREVVLGYNFTSSLLKKSPFAQARVACSSRNPWIILQKTPKGIDPEAATTSGNGQGFEYGSLPPMTTYGVNLKLTFK